MDLGGIFHQSPVRRSDAIGASSSRGKRFGSAGGDGVSERGGGFCCELEKGQPDKQSPVLACMHVSRDCLS